MELEIQAMMIRQEEKKKDIQIGKKLIYVFKWTCLYKENLNTSLLTLKQLQWSSEPKINTQTNGMLYWTY